MLNSCILLINDFSTALTLKLGITPQRAIWAKYFSLYKLLNYFILSINYFSLWNYFSLRICFSLTIWTPLELFSVYRILLPSFVVVILARFLFHGCSSICSSISIYHGLFDHWNCNVCDEGLISKTVMPWPLARKDAAAERCCRWGTRRIGG